MQSQMHYKFWIKVLWIQKGINVSNIYRNFLKKNITNTFQTDSIYQAGSTQIYVFNV